APLRAHSGAAPGALLHEPDKPGWFLPITGRLYFRKSQLPAGPEGLLEFRTKCELAVELFREQARIAPGHKHLGVVDGGYALASVVRPLVLPERGAPRVDVLTPLRHDARLFALPPAARLASGGAPGGDGGTGSEWGRAAPPAPPGRLLGAGLADRPRLHLRPRAEGPLEGGHLLVARAGLGGTGQGGRGASRGVQEAVH